MLGALMVVGAGCHLVYPYEAGRVRRDAAADGARDGLAADGPRDALAATEQGPPDGLPAEGPGPGGDGPAVDGGGVCATLAVRAGAPWQISNGKTSSSSAGTPAIAWLGGYYFVTYAQDAIVYVAQVDPAAGPVRMLISMPAGEPATPAITTDGQGAIVVAWHAQTATPCTRPVSVFSATLTAQGLTPHGACVVSGSCATQPYGPVALAHAGGQFLLAAGLGWTVGPECPVGAGAKTFRFSQPTSGCPTAAAWPPCADGPLVSGTGYFAASPLPSGGPFDFALLSLAPAGASYDVSLYYFDGAAQQWLNAGLSDSAGAGRPALADDGTGRWLAWTSLTRSALVVSYVAPVSASLLLSATGGDAALREPALAVRPPGNGGVLLAYSAWQAGSLEPHPAAIRARLLAVTGNAIDGPAALDVVAPAGSAAVTEQPRSPAVAAGAGGYGVAWLQNVGGRAEVFMQHLACAP